MQTTPTLWQWLFKDKKHNNLKQLIIQYIFITAILIGAFASLYDTEYYWAIILGLFTGLMYGICLLRVILIYIRLLRINYFKGK
jgi:hypothetical protein